MIAANTVSEVYRATESLIVHLNAGRNDKLAAILHHRLHDVAWTDSSELLEELRNVLSKAMDYQSSENEMLPQNEINELIAMIDSLL